MASGGPSDPSSWNRYSYTEGDPINGNDPSGLFVRRFVFDTPADDLGTHWLEGMIHYAGLTGPTLTDTLVDEWDNLSPTCQSALGTAMPGGDNDATNATRVKALNRAIAASATLQSATSGTGIDWTVLAAIGIRETQFRNIDQKGGKGVGVFQVDLGQNPSVTSGQASDITWAANWAAATLSSNNRRLASLYPNLDPAHLIQATAASWNLGVGGISGNPDTIDRGSAGDNYGSNVVGLMDCFH